MNLIAEEVELIKRKLAECYMNIHEFKLELESGKFEIKTIKPNSFINCTANGDYCRTCRFNTPNTAMCPAGFALEYDIVPNLKKSNPEYFI